MGFLGHALSSASSSVGNAVGSAENSIGLGGGTPTPAPSDPSSQTDPLSYLQAMSQSTTLPSAQTPDMSQANPQQSPAVPNNPYTPDDGQAVANPIAASANPDPNQSGSAQQQPIDVNGDNWAPTHESLLARVGDIFFGNVFHNRIEEKDKEDLMQGFQKDPETAIARMRQIDPKMAWNMYNQYIEDQSRQATEKKSDAATNVLIDKAVIPQMYGLVQSVASADPSKRDTLWDAVRPRILAVGQQYGRDYSTMFPEKFDADTMSAAIGQAINPARQQSLGQGQEKINQTGQKIQLQTEDVHSKIDRRQAETQQGQARVTQSQQRLTDTEHNTANKPANTVTPVHLPDGSAGIKKKVGNTWFLSFQRNGTNYVFTGSDGQHWQPYGTAKAK